jgi:hypothetical protein
VAPQIRQRRPSGTIAETNGMSEMALNVALQTPHRAMPNIMLDPQERADVVAYILSLKGDYTKTPKS